MEQEKKEFVQYVLHARNEWNRRTRAWDRAYWLWFFGVAVVMIGTILHIALAVFLRSP